MPFHPSEHQLQILRALYHLEFVGCAHATLDGKKTKHTTTFRRCVPEIFLKAWVGDSTSQFERDVNGLVSRRLVSTKPCKRWPFPFRSVGLWTPDDRAIHVSWQSMDSGEFAELFIALLRATGTASKTLQKAKKPGPTLSLQFASPPKPGVFALAWVGVPRGRTLERPQHFTQWSSESVGEFYQLRKRGLELLDELDDHEVGSELVTLDQVAPLCGCSKRTLERRLKDGILPEPDSRGGGGQANKWHWKTLRPALGEMAKRQLPTRFPGSRII